MIYLSIGIGLLILFIAWLWRRFLAQHVHRSYGHAVLTHSWKKLLFGAGIFLAACTLIVAVSSYPLLPPSPIDADQIRIATDNRSSNPGALEVRYVIAVNVLNTKARVRKTAIFCPGEHGSTIMICDLDHRENRRAVTSMEFGKQYISDACFLNSALLKHGA